jgi:NAD(P)-dependent dehydrogenase (short-subunit alcohol dehydrogenase family)
MTEPVKQKTMIVTGASQGIGAGVTKAFIKRGYNVVANSRKITESEFTPTDRLVLVDGNIGEASTAAQIAAKAMSTSGSIDGVVNNAGIFFSKRFTDYTVRDFELLSETKSQGYVYITPACSEADAGTKSRREHHGRHVGDGGASHRGSQRFNPDDHQGRP